MGSLIFLESMPFCVCAICAAAAAKGCSRVFRIARRTVLLSSGGLLLHDGLIDFSGAGPKMQRAHQLIFKWRVF